MMLWSTSTEVATMLFANVKIIVISELDSAALYNLINFIIGIRPLITITEKVYINTFKVCRDFSGDNKNGSDGGYGCV